MLINWKFKNIVYCIISNMPFGKMIYYILQKYITKTVWVSDNQFESYYEMKVVKHLKFIKKYGQCPIDKAIFF